MKVERTFTSGTGNGVGKEYYAEFVSALEKEVALIKKFIAHYKKTGAEKMFGSDMYALNNWHGEYVIQTYDRQAFPYHMANRVGFDSWGHIEIGVVIPMRFKAPMFGGGETDNMKAVFKIKLNVTGLKEFLRIRTLPPHIKQEVLHAARDYFVQRTVDDKKEARAFVERQVERLKELNTETEEVVTETAESIANIEIIDEALAKFEKRAS